MNAPCLLCNNFIGKFWNLTRFDCIGEGGCGRTHKVCDSCWMSDTFTVCPIKKEKMEDENNKCCEWCGEDGDGETSLCEECSQQHSWCVKCERTFCPVKKRKKKLRKYYKNAYINLIEQVCEDLSKKYCVEEILHQHSWCVKCERTFCPVKKRKKKLRKYYKNAYINLIEQVCEDLSKKYCVGCMYFSSPGFSHSCLLHRNDKIKQFVRIAIKIINKSGIITVELKKILEKKNKIVFSYDEINELFETPLSYSSLRKNIELTYV